MTDDFSHLPPPSEINHDLVGFDAGYRWVVRNPYISTSARLLYVILCSFASGRLGCVVSNERLARYLGCKRRSVQALIRELTDKQAIVSILSSEGTRRKILINAEVSIIGKSGADADKCTPPVQNSASPHAVKCTQDIEKEIEKGINTRKSEDSNDNEEIEIQFRRFYESYDPKARYGDKKQDIRKQWEKTLAEGHSPEEIIGAVERKKARLEAFKKAKGEFEPNFPYPLKFLRKALWKAVGTLCEPKKRPCLGGIDLIYRNIPFSYLTDLRRLKATDRQLKELNDHWAFWSARRLTTEGMTDALLLKEADRMAKDRAAEQKDTL